MGNQVLPISITQYRALPILILLYFTIMLSSVVLVYKIVAFGPLVIAASTLVIPFWYFLGDVIAEVYGYKISKQLIWGSLICEGLFILITYSFIHLPSPSFWHNQTAYDLTIGKLPRIYLGSILGVISSSFINAYAIVRWKVLLKGKYFWLRSLCASSIGEIIFTIVTISVDLFKVIPTHDLIRLIAISYCTKLMVDLIAITPASILVQILKKIEGVDMYEYDIEFSPFSLDLAIQHIKR